MPWLRCGQRQIGVLEMMWSGARLYGTFCLVWLRVKYGSGKEGLLR